MLYLVSVVLVQRGLYVSRPGDTGLGLLDCLRSCSTSSRPHQSSCTSYHLCSYYACVFPPGSTCKKFSFKLGLLHRRIILYLHKSVEHIVREIFCVSHLHWRVLVVVACTSDIRGCSQMTSTFFGVSDTPWCLCQPIIRF